MKLNNNYDNKKLVCQGPPDVIRHGVNEIILNEPIREKESRVENGAWLLGSCMEMSEFNHT